MAIERYTNLTSRPTVSDGSGITSGATTVTPSNTTGFPSTGQGRILIGSELCLVTDFSVSPWPITRGIEGTTAAAHNLGDFITPVLTAGGLNALHTVQVDNIFIAAERGVNFKTSASVSFTVTDNPANSWIDITGTASASVPNPQVYAVNATISFSDPTKGLIINPGNFTVTSGLVTVQGINATAADGIAGANAGRGFSFHTGNYGGSGSSISGGNYNIYLGTGSDSFHAGNFNVIAPYVPLGRLSNSFIVNVTGYGLGIGNGQANINQMLAVQGTFVDFTPPNGGNEYVGSNFLLTTSFTQDLSATPGLYYIFQSGVFSAADNFASNIATLSAAQFEAHVNNLAGTINKVYGSEFYAQTDVASLCNVSFFYGILSNPSHAGAGTLINAFGVRGLLQLTPSNAATDGNITALYGARMDLQNTATHGVLGTNGVIAEADLYYAFSPTISGIGSVTNFYGFRSDALFNTPNNSFATGGFFNYGAKLVGGKQGGNTSAIDTNVALQATVGIGVPNGGTVTNIGVEIIGNGGTGGAGTLNNFAIKATSTAQSIFNGPIAFGPTSGAARTDAFVTTDITYSVSYAANYGFYSIARANNVVTSRITGYTSLIILNSTSFTVAEWNGYWVNNPTYTSGLVTAVHGVNIPNLANSSFVGTAVGVWVQEQSGPVTVGLADLVLGNTKPSGTTSYALYASSSLPSTFLGSLLVRTNTPPSSTISFGLTVGVVSSANSFNYGAWINQPTSATTHNIGLLVGPQTFTATQLNGLGAFIQGGTAFKGGSSVSALVDTAATDAIINLTAGDNAATNNTNAYLFFARGASEAGLFGFTTNVAAVVAGHTKTLTDLAFRIGGNYRMLLDSSGNLFVGAAATVAGLVTGTAGLTVSGADVSLNASSNFNFHLMDGNSTGTITIGNSAVGQVLLLTKSNQANAMKLQSNNQDLYVLDTSSAIGTSLHYFKGQLQTIPTSNGLQYQNVLIGGPTLSLTGTTTVANLAGLGLYILAPAVSNVSFSSAAQASTFYIQGAPTATGSFSYTAAYAMHIGSGNTFMQGQLKINTGSDTVDGLLINSNSSFATNYAITVNNADTADPNIGGGGPVPVFRVLPYIPNNPTAIQNTVLIWGQFPATMTGSPLGTPTAGVDAYILHVRGAGQGSSSFAGQHVIRAHFEPGGSTNPWGTNYTGTMGTSAVNAQNDANGTGITPISGGGGVHAPGEQYFTADFGVEGLSQGVSVGWNWGVGGISDGSTTMNGGVLGAAVADASGARNIGMLAVAANTATGTHMTGGWFELNQIEPPTILDCALGANNGSFAKSVFVAQVNGTTTFLVSSTGQVSIAPAAVSGGAVGLLINPGQHTNVSFETFSTNHTPHTYTITAGYATQRFHRFGIPVLSAGSALTVTTAATVAIEGAPGVAGSAAITNSLALWVQAGQTRLDGQVATSRAYHKVSTNNGLLSTSSGQSITLTAAILVGGFLEHTVTTGAATDTLDTGTNISAAIPGATVGDAFVFTLVNKSGSAFAITLASATGATIQGTPSTIAQNRSAILTFINTGANTWDVFVNVSA